MNQSTLQTLKDENMSYINIYPLSAESFIHIFMLGALVAPRGRYLSTPATVTLLFPKGWNMKSLPKVIEVALEFWWLLTFYSIFLGLLVIIPFMVLKGIFDFFADMGTFWVLVFVFDILPISLWIVIVLSRGKSEGKDKTIHDVVMALFILVGSLIFLTMAWMIFNLIVAYWLQFLLVIAATGGLVLFWRKIRISVSLKIEKSE